MDLPETPRRAPRPGAAYACCPQIPAADLCELIGQAAWGARSPTRSSAIGSPILPPHRRARCPQDSTARLRPGAELPQATARPADHRRATCSSRAAHCEVRTSTCLDGAASNTLERRARDHRSVRFRPVAARYRSILGRGPMLRRRLHRMLNTSRTPAHAASVRHDRGQQGSGSLYCRAPAPSI